MANACSPKPPPFPENSSVCSATAMLPSRITDAARISPYPRINPAFEQERSPSLSANSVSASTEGSLSKARLVAEAAAAAAAASSNRPMRTVERSSTGNGRQGKAEERFNVGAPRNPKNFLRRNWRGKSSRSILEGIEEGKWQRRFSSAHSIQN